MELPPAAELSRWTIYDVSNWLARSSLAVFRDAFLYDCVDGSKLMRLKPHEVDERYRNIPPKKRNVLKDHLTRIVKATPAWSPSHAPLPPRPAGPGPSRAPLPPHPPPVTYEYADDESDWDEEDDDLDYLDPVSETPQPWPGGNDAIGRVQQFPQEPENFYENPLDEDEETRGHCLTKESPPPRPPRNIRPSVQLDESPKGFIQPAHHARHPSPIQNIAPPDGFYEVMNPVCPEKESPLPPRPTRKIANERPPRALPGQGNSFTSHVQSQGGEEDDLRAYDWYHGKIGRDLAQMIFKREQKDGMFLIRKSERDLKQPYTLVTWHINRIWNIPIRKKDNGKYAAGKFKQNETEFSSIFELVEHFKVASLGLKTDSQVKGCNNLTIPAPMR